VWLGDRELLLGDECGYGTVAPDGSVEPACRAYFGARTVAPAATVMMKIGLYRSLTGMNQVGERDYVYRKPIEYRSTAPFTPEDRVGAEEGELVIAYSNLG
jgi:hypothetical protein